ncbi:MAG: arylsulfatase [Verrucomicrobiaceae bacterium]|nr:arylsulfatase [Verrucomicrobiaceae bacterium]
MNLLTTLLICVLAWAGNALAKQPNIVLILVDDMGYGDPGCYNADSKIPTPNIDRLAHDGMRFTDAHASGPLCHVSRYGLMTGTYPWRTEFNWRRQPVIAAEQETIASFLKSQGYRTSMVGKWHLGFTEKLIENYAGELRGGPVDRGFESYFGIRASTDIPPYFYIRGNRAVMPPSATIADNNTKGWTRIQGAFWRKGKIAPDLKLEEVLPRFTREAVSVITGHSEDKDKKPLFLYLAYPAPHTPWLPSRQFTGKSKAGLYGDFMMMVDAMIGNVLKALDTSGMREDTLVIFSSDNGPVWYDQDVEKFGHDSSGGLRGMKADAWEAGHRMPFIVRWPGKVGAGGHTDHTICFTDLFATFATICGKSLPDSAAPDSFDFSPVLLGLGAAGDKQRPPIVMAAGGGTMLIRDGNWKLINALGSGGFSNPRRRKPQSGEPEGQLYNLSSDMGEQTNLYLKHPEIVTRLNKQLATIRKSRRTRP